MVLDILQRGSRHKPTLGFLGVLVTLFYTTLGQLPHRHPYFLLGPPSFRINRFEVLDLANRLHLISMGNQQVIVKWLSYSLRKWPSRDQTLAYEFVLKIEG